MRTSIDFGLDDKSVVGKETPCNVKINSSGIYVSLEGFGDFCSNDGEGTPIMIEKYDGEIRVVIWGDINQEDPTHIIPLTGAKESLRKSD